jgi:hypothetical protein
MTMRALGQDIARKMRVAFPIAVSLIFLAAGCATSPPGQEDSDNDLLASTAVVNRMALEQESVIEVGRFSQLRPGGSLEAYWEPYTLQPADPATRYSVAEVGGQICVEADATNGHSALQRLMHISPQRNPIVDWSWYVPRLASDDKVTGKPTPRARLMLAFHGDESKIDIEQRVKLRMAKAIFGRKLPYSSLIYAWLKGVPEGTVVPSPYTESVKLIAMDSSRPNTWQRMRRNVLDDYRRAFDGEEPGDIVGIGIFTDVDANGAPGRACYGDITISGP